MTSTGIWQDVSQYSEMHFVVQADIGITLAWLTIYSLKHWLTPEECGSVEDLSIFQEEEN